MGPLVLVCSLGCRSRWRVLEISAPNVLLSLFDMLSLSADLFSSLSDRRVSSSELPELTRRRLRLAALGGGGGVATLLSDRLLTGFCTWQLTMLISSSLSLTSPSSLSLLTRYGHYQV